MLTLPAANVDLTMPRQSVLFAVVTLVVVAGLGLLSFVLPTVLAGGTLLPAPLFPLLRSSVEHLTWIPLAGLVVIGAAAGVFTRLPPALIALASVIAFPVAMLAELVADPTSHNLFPFEMAMYLAFAQPPFVAAMAGRWLHRRMIATRGPVAIDQ